MTLRCHQKVGARPPAWCGQPACWLRPGSALFKESVYCADHRAAGDIALDPARPFRRVRLTVTVDLAAVSWMPAEAHNDAVDRVGAALEALGGVVNLVNVGSQVVQNGTEPGSLRSIGGPVVPV